ncbi:MAG: ribonuclease III [Clostridiales bacterium]|nr:ribonuclease III [Clostridiales bacterium]
MKYKKLEKAIKYKFNNLELLTEALTHSSFKNENRNYKGKDNERLEFFGDSILSFVITEYLFNKLDNQPEGGLTKARANIVCEETLSDIAREINLGEYIRFGKGEIITGGKERISILADALEALIGAVYIDSDVSVINKFILDLLKEKIDMVISGKIIFDYKTALQEKLQKKGKVEILYEVIEEEGPDHSKIFTIEVSADKLSLGQGKGKNKKEAEQNAAKEALEKGVPL